MFTEVFLPKIDGVVTRVLRTLEELAELGHEAIVFAPGDPPPVYAGFERLPNSLLDASGDLGAHNLYTFRRVILPLVFPSIVAGSMFTFSLSLGDYITAQIIGGKLQMLGNVVYQNYSLNLPFAATMSSVPIVIMTIYLWSVRRSGALKNI